MKRIWCGTMLVAAVAFAQNARDEYRVPLELSTDTIQSMGLGLRIESGPENALKAAAPGGLELRIERMPSGILVHVPGGDPATLALLPEQSSIVQIKRASFATALPYSIAYGRDEHQGKVYETLFWQSAYRVEGRIRMNGCSMGLMLLDLNGDGVFDRQDFRKGTSIGSDFNDDGRVRGANEYRKAEEIIDLCGVPLEVADLDTAGRFITFRRSELRVPTVGQPAPAFTVQTTTGQSVQSSAFGGRVHVLDFWATWCAPCVEKLGPVDALAREHRDRLTVIGINVDEPAKRDAAFRLLAEKKLSFPQVVRAQGEQDFLWKMFGSMNGVSFGIPLYVVFDRGGIIRYAGDGGNDANDLRSAIDAALASR